MQKFCFIKALLINNRRYGTHTIIDGNEGTSCNVYKLKMAIKGIAVLIIFYFKVNKIPSNRTSEYPISCRKLLLYHI